ncbi:hypothetical protein FJY68_11575 [candidate division WOR-3 bacterium]|uniref:HYDIN/VesB/CFA65-like Ig-like domain-containing protein n=1 Tax=candidate division WOR-3 bacterium TaxID=2052148 RepID=A0A937XIY4_UNCW3|nr:hypothetical protein [candidate division WOR-3 bacterium]
MSAVNLVATIVCAAALAGVARADFDGLRFLGHNQVNRNHEMDAEIVGDRAFIACGFSQGLESYDISNPASPTRTWLSNGPNSWRCRAYGDTWLFDYCRREGVVLFDISGSGDPLRLGTYDPPGNREALEGGALVGSMLYCAAHQNGIYALDFSNPTSPQKIGALSLNPSQAWNVEARDSFLFVANGREGLAVAGLADGMHVTARLDLPGTATDIVLEGNVAVLALGVAGLATIDITDPHNPVLLDTIATDGCVWGIGNAGNLVVAGSWRVMELFDVSNPASITRVGWDNTYMWAHGADIRDDSLIVVADWQGMSCYRVGNDPGADIDVMPEILDFGDVSGQRDTTVVVRNTGAGTLDVTSVRAPAGISATPDSFTVGAGDSLLVTLTATGPGLVGAQLRFDCNDPDESARTIEVYENNPAFPQYGAEAPDFNLSGTDGQTHRLSAERGKVVYLDFGASW